MHTEIPGWQNTNYTYAAAHTAHHQQSRIQRTEPIHTIALFKWLNSSMNAN